MDNSTIETLKSLSSQVNILYIGDKPRYFPDIYNTHANNWQVTGGFNTDLERDQFAIKNCTAFIAIDFNSTLDRISSTAKIIKTLNKLEKNNLLNIV